MDNKEGSQPMDNLDDLFADAENELREKTVPKDGQPGGTPPSSTFRPIPRYSEPITIEPVAATQPETTQLGYADVDAGYSEVDRQPVRAPSDPILPPTIEPTAVPAEPARKRGWKMPNFRVPFGHRPQEPATPHPATPEPVVEQQLTPEQVSRADLEFLYKYFARRKPRSGPVDLEKVAKESMPRVPGDEEGVYEEMLKEQANGYIRRIIYDLLDGNIHPTDRLVRGFKDLLGDPKKPNSAFRKVLDKVAELIQDDPDRSPYTHEWGEYRKAQGLTARLEDEPETTPAEEGEAAAVEVLMQNEPFRKRVMEAIDRRVPSWARPTKEQLAYLAGGAAFGFAVKTGMRIAFSAAGATGLPATVAIAGVGGAAVAGGKEWVKQIRERESNFKEQLEKDYEERLRSISGIIDFDDRVKAVLELNESSETTRLEHRRDTFKKKLEFLKPADVKRLAVKTALGGGTGALGAVIGFEVASLLADHADEIGTFLAGLKDRLPEIRLPEVKPFLGGPPQTSAPAPLEPVATGSPEPPSQSPTVPGVPESPADVEPPVDQPDVPDTQAPPVEEKTYRVNMPSIGQQASLNTEGTVLSSVSPGGFTDPGAEAADSFPTPSPVDGGASAITSPDSGLGAPAAPAASAPAEVGAATSPATPGGVSNVTEAAPAAPSAEVPGTPEYVNRVTGEVFKLDSEPLKQGSNLWNVAKDKLTEGLGHEPTNAQIQELTSTLARENGVAVPEWGITGSVDARSLPVGYKVLYNDSVKGAFKGILSRG